MQIVRPVVATVGGIAHRVRDLNRLQQVARILVGHGLGTLVAGIALPGQAPFFRGKFESTPERAAAALQQLGPTFVKLGQVLSTRPDLLPEAYCTAFEQLQDDVDPLPFAEIEATLRDELGEQWRSLIAEFSDEPLATASIAQVHRATLRDGRHVVLKVQRRGIRRTIEADLNILHLVARGIVSEFPEARSFDPRGILLEFERSIMSELDFLTEAENTRRMAKNFTGDARVRIPFVIDEVTSQSVLCMEYLDGTPIRRARESGFDMAVVGERYLTVAYDMLFVHGFFHGDLHPGNVLVLDDAVLGILDFGMVGRLTREMRANVLSIMIAAERGDHRTIARLCYDIAIKDRRVDYPALERDTLTIVERNLSGESMADIEIGRLVNDLTNAAARHGARVPLSYTMFFKALLTSEGLAKSLLHEQNPIAAAQPYFQRMLLESVSEEKLKQDALYYGLTLSSLGKRLPVTVSQILDDVDNQRLVLQIREHGDPAVGQRTDRQVNRLILASGTIGCFGFGTLASLGDPLSILGLPLVSLCFWSAGAPLAAMTALAIARNRGVN